MNKTEEKLPTLGNRRLFDYKDHIFRFEILPDEDMGEPWKEHDGHGIVSNWVVRQKRAGERVLASRHDVNFLYYDMPKTMELALKDGWGISDEKTAELFRIHGHKPTPREIASQAAEDDYIYMREWCENVWHWVGVVVTMMKEDDDAIDGLFVTKFNNSVWGIESDSGADYLSTIGYECADECIAEYERAHAK